MKTLIISVIVLIIIIGAGTAIWKHSHNFFYSLVREVFLGAVLIIVLLLCWKYYWKYYDPQETKVYLDYIKYSRGHQEKNIPYRENQSQSSDSNLLRP